MRPSWAWALRISHGRRRPIVRLATLALGFLSYINTDAADSSDYFVHSLPGAPDGPLLKMHAGHIQTDPEHNGGLFFWHYQNRHIGDRQRTVIWLNGGPGCSSMDGALMEIGPYRVREGGKLEYNKGSWDEFANLLFVDNPVGTGFSYVDTNAFLHDLPQMADQFIIFLEKWFSMFPEYEHDDIYLAGESYAGQHIPYIADAMLKRNSGMFSHGWNLRGLLIGNGWISPADQYSSYTEFSYKGNIIETGTPEADRIEDLQVKCFRRMNEQPGGPNSRGHVEVPECEAILQRILLETRNDRAPKEKQCINMYDTRLRDSYPSCGMNWPPDLAHVTPYLRDPAVLAALNIDPAKKSTGWQECVGQVSQAFRTPNSVPSIQLLPKILSHVPILLFSGADDLICNHIGTETLIDNMSWNGGKGFETSGVMAPRREWTFEGENAGMWQEARNLTYVLFYESSHMVPFDHPRRTRDMLDRFMGVDIASVGGPPADSRIGGQKGIETSVGGHPNSTVAKEEEVEKLEQAKWDAYYRSGEVALIVVIIMASVWAWYVWRDRRQRSGYGRVASEGDSTLDIVMDGIKDTGRGAMRMEQFRHEAGRSGGRDRDLEAADFDEGEVDAAEGRGMTRFRDTHSIGSDVSDDVDHDDYTGDGGGVKGKGKAGPNGA